MTRRLFGALGAVGALAVVLTPAPAAAAGGFIGGFSTVSTVASTVPGNGDVNPYGVAVVPRSTGRLVAGDVLVSNFNDAGNLQGTGTTIVQVSPSGGMSLFAHIDASRLPGRCPGGVGLTTALSALPHGFVVVGSLPTRNGKADTARAGCLLVLDSRGQVVETISGGPVNGPWDMTAVGGDGGATLFVTNVLNGTVAAHGGVVDGGTVVRIRLGISEDEPPVVRSMTVIASGFPERTDPAALVIGPTGVGLGSGGTLYVADSLDNRVAAVADAMTRGSTAHTGADVSVGGALNDPLGLAIAPNGDVITTNGNDGNLVETTPGGTQVAVVPVDSSGSPPGAGALFGLAVTPTGMGVYFVDDATNTLDLLH